MRFSVILTTVCLLCLCLCSCGNHEDHSQLAATTAGAAAVSTVTAVSTVSDTVLESMITTDTTTFTTAVSTVGSSFVPSISQDMIYDELKKAAEQFRYTISIDGCADEADIDKAFLRFYDDFPEYFWVRNYRYSLTDRQLTIGLEEFQNCKSAQLRQMFQEMNAETDKILSMIPAAASDYEKALFVHDYLIEHTDFDYQKDGADDSGKYRICHTAYGCIAKGNAVCEGYSRAYQYLMKRLSIPCGTCSGIAGGDRHAWNYIYLEGDYYWADLTWDDPYSMEHPDKHSISHAYFLVNDEMLGRSHTLAVENTFVPECKATKLNYFIQNGLCFQSYHLSEFDRQLTEAHTEFMFSNEEAYQLAIKKLFTEGEIWQTALMNQKNYSINYSKKDDVYVISINLE